MPCEGQEKAESVQPVEIRCEGQEQTHEHVSSGLSYDFWVKGGTERWEGEARPASGALRAVLVANFKRCTLGAPNQFLKMLQEMGHRSMLESFWTGFHFWHPLSVLMQHKWFFALYLVATLIMIASTFMEVRSLSTFGSMSSGYIAYRFTVLQHRAGGLVGGLTGWPVSDFGVLDSTGCIVEMDGIEISGTSTSVTISFPAVVDMDGYYFVTSETNPLAQDPVRFEVHGSGKRNSTDEKDWERVGSSFWRIYDGRLLVYSGLDGRVFYTPEERGAMVKVKMRPALAHWFVQMRSLPYVVSMILIGLLSVVRSRSWNTNLNTTPYGTVLGLGRGIGAILCVVATVEFYSMKFYAQEVVLGCALSVHSALECVVWLLYERHFTDILWIGNVTLIGIFSGYNSLAFHDASHTYSERTLASAFVSVVAITISSLRLYYHAKKYEYVRKDKKLFDEAWAEIEATEQAKIRQLDVFVQSVKINDEQQNQWSLRQINKVWPDGIDSAKNYMSFLEGKVHVDATRRPEFNKKSPIISLDQLYVQACGVEHVLRGKVQAWAEHARGSFPVQKGSQLLYVPWSDAKRSPQLQNRVIFSGVKPLDRCIHKIIFCYRSDPSRLMDLCRERIVFKDVDNLLECLKLICEDEEVSVVRVKNTMVEGARHDTGFRCVTVHLRLFTKEVVELGCDSLICEVQLVHIKVAKLVTSEKHRTYIEYRDVRDHSGTILMFLYKKLSSSQHHVKRVVKDKAEILTRHGSSLQQLLLRQGGSMQQLFWRRGSSMRLFSSQVAPDFSESDGGEATDARNVLQHGVSNDSDRTKGANEDQGTSQGKSQDALSCSFEGEVPSSGPSTSAHVSDPSSQDGLSSVGDAHWLLLRRHFLLSSTIPGGSLSQDKSLVKSAHKSGAASSALYTTDGLRSALHKKRYNLIMLACGMAVMFTTYRVFTGLVFDRSFSHFRFTAVETRSGLRATAPHIDRFGLLPGDACTRQAFLQHRNFSANIAEYDHDGSAVGGNVHTDGAHMFLSFSEPVNADLGFWFRTMSNSTDEDPVKFMLHASNDGKEWIAVGGSKGSEHRKSSINPPFHPGYFNTPFDREVIVTFDYISTRWILWSDSFLWYFLTGLFFCVPSALILLQLEHYVIQTMTAMMTAIVTVRTFDVICYFAMNSPIEAWNALLNIPGGWVLLYGLTHPAWFGQSMLWVGLSETITRLIANAVLWPPFLGHDDAIPHWGISLTCVGLFIRFTRWRVLKKSLTIINGDMAEYDLMWSELLQKEDNISALLRLRDVVEAGMAKAVKPQVSRQQCRQTRKLSTISEKLEDTTLTHSCPLLHAIPEGTIPGTIDEDRPVHNIESLIAQAWFMNTILKDKVTLWGSFSGGLFPLLREKDGQNSALGTTSSDLSLMRGAIQPPIILTDSQVPAQQTTLHLLEPDQQLLKFPAPVRRTLRDIPNAPGMYSDDQAIYDGSVPQTPLPIHSASQLSLGMNEESLDTTSTSSQTQMAEKSAALSQVRIRPSANKQPLLRMMLKLSTTKVQRKCSDVSTSTSASASMDHLQQAHDSMNHHQHEYITWTEALMRPQALERIRWGKIKSLPRAFEKLTRSYGYDCSRLVDLCRQAIVFDSIDALTMCLQCIIADPQVQLIVIKNRLDLDYDSSKSAGYRDVALLLRISTPEALFAGCETHICELQLVLKQIADLKKNEGHKRYTIWRNVRGE